MTAPVTIDYETGAIQPRPNYPPKPVGVSIKFPGKKAHYYAFAHPEGNNCTKQEAVAALKEAYAHEGGILCHNSKFDLDVSETHMGLKMPHWSKVWDTMFEVFLDNPHAPSHALKPSAERLLDMPSTERDAVKDWLVEHGYCTKASKDWGAFIAFAPGDLVGSYADGDVIRTEKLHALLMKTLKKRKMLGAYDRERELMPILLDMERQGVEVDTDRLVADCAVLREDEAKLIAWVRKQLKSKDLNVSSGIELVAALGAAEKIDLSLLAKTPTGAWKTDKASLDAAITDKALVSVLAHLASLQTCVGTFMEKWRDTALASGGKIFTNWNQLKQYGTKGVAGAVTGRMSSNPNFQNIPKEFPAYWKHQDKSKPKCPIAGLSPLPLVRSYIIAPAGHTLVGRDYSQQEIRILAHYEDGDLKAGYLQDPWMDAHDTATGEINTRLCTNFQRGVVKQINFGLIYGMGVGLMATKASCTVEEAGKAKRAVLNIYPGLKDLQRGLKDLAAANLPLRTWGGREYFVEPPKLRPDGTIWSFEYKMLNVLIQGSAADCTKQAMINYYNAKPKTHKLLLQVHDELLVAVPTVQVAKGMALLRECMERVTFDVPMLSDGKTSTTNWSEMKTYDKKGVKV